MRKLIFIFIIILWLFISNVFVDFDVCFKGLYFNSIRCIRSTYNIFNYNTLINAIEDGEILVSDDREHPLNNIPSNFKGQYALYYLAQALDEAMVNGEIKWERGKTNFETNRLNRLPSEYTRMLGARKTVISYKKFFEWKQNIESDLAKYSGNEGQIRFVFDYEVENIARLYDIFGSQYGWNKLHVMLSQIVDAIDLFEINPSPYKGENGQKKLAKAVHISHPWILYYARNEFEEYSQDNFRWSKNVFTAKELEKIKQRMLSLSIESGVDIFDSIFIVHRELFNLAQQYGREKVVAFLKNVGTLGMSFMSQDEENTARLIQLVQQDNWRDVVTYYLEINSQIEDCCKIYGFEARGISDNDKITLGDYLHALDVRVKEIFSELNNLIFTCVLKSDIDTVSVAKHAQEDLILLFNILSAYKNNQLSEIKNSKYEYTFNNVGYNCRRITLRLHPYKTGVSQASIRWEIEKFNGDIISLRLDNDESRGGGFCLDVDSLFLEELYKIMNRKEGHHFYFNMPKLSSKSFFKTLVRIFYKQL